MTIHRKSYYLVFSAILLLSTSLRSQSTSVFDAAFFNKDNVEPPIRVGKGFHINDVYKQTKHCFTSETSGQDKLIRSQEGTKTVIKLFYTRNSEEYNYLKTQGGSGKISFLNLFSMGGSKLQEYSTKEDNEEEKLVFIAKVDFGVYSYDRDPLLAPEANDMITQGKHDDFVQLYGTHYISGVRKENSIWIVLTKEQSINTQNTNDQNSVNIETLIPDGKAGFEINDGTETENLINSYKYSVSVEINGPSMKRGDIQKKISKILSGDSKNKLDDIKDILTKASEELADQNMSLITQYYYSPFDLYNLKGIYWDENKQNSLIKINDAALKMYNLKLDMNELLKPLTRVDFATDYLKDLPDEFSKKELYKKKLGNKYAELLPALKNYQAQADLRLTQLETNYKSCSDIKCNQQANCCNNLTGLNDVSLICSNSKKEVDKLDAIRDMAVNDYIKEVNTPECETKKQGIITITNKSSNPYELFQGDKFIEIIGGGAVKQYLVDPGIYNFKAQQRSGYLMYPTVNLRTATIQTACEEFAVLIGYED